METQPKIEHTEARWHARTTLAWIVRIALLLLPVVASVVFVLLATRTVPRPPWLIGTIAWWVALTAAATLVLRVVDRWLQKFVPVVALLRLSLTFPDQAPSRFRLALKSGTVKQLERRVQQGRLKATAQGAAEDLLMLAGSLGQHDRLTRGHSERVRAYSDLIADEMGLKQRDRDRLHWAALLHDIGKLDVPHELLNKDSAPTEAEWAVIRRHPARAEFHLAPLAHWLGEWRLAASQHHERWDGDGYPMGLAGEQISLAGRIVAVADAYDTITSVRSYKRAASAEQGRAEIARCAGTHFDPAVVKAFLNVSVGRLRAIMGPLSLLANAPILASVPTAAAPTVTSTITAGAAVMAMGVAGVAAPPAEPPEEPGLVFVVTEQPVEPEFALAFADPTPDRRPIELSFPTITPVPTDTELVLELPTPVPLAEPTRPPAGGPTTARPTATPTAPTTLPDPSSTPTPTPAVSPTPTPGTASPLLLFLENPGTGPTTSSPVLPMTMAKPSTPLANYDVDRDKSEGLWLRKSSRGLAETDPNRIQVWAQSLEGTRVAGRLTAEVYAAPRYFIWVEGDEVLLTAGVQQCDASLADCVTLGQDTRPLVQTGPTFAPVSYDFGEVDVTFDAARPMLVVRALVPLASQKLVFLAYDADLWPAHVAVSTP